MIKLIVGSKGSGKTKTLISMCNEAVKNTDGCVVCIEKAMSLQFSIVPQVRLIHADAYNISGYDEFYGFISGVLAGNYDIKDIFVDGILRIGQPGLGRSGRAAGPDPGFGEGRGHRGGHRVYRCGKPPCQRQQVSGLKSNPKRESGVREHSAFLLWKRFSADGTEPGDWGRAFPFLPGIAHDILNSLSRLKVPHPVILGSSLVWMVSWKLAPVLTSH